jgi:quercetin dioxygenase-like cupin family protein
MNKKQNINSHQVKMAQLTIVDSINDALGVETLEGRIGPLLNGLKGAAHYIIMPPNMYCDAHQHPTESIIFTTKGQWVLCSEGKRHLMKEGSLFFMPPDVETGYEVPFDEAATILIIKFEGPNDPEKFLTYLEGLKGRLETRHKQGTPFLMSELPVDHPARVFAQNLK